MPGRKPKPSKLKILQGTNRKDRMNSAEPQYARGIGEPPEWLDQDGAKIWKELSVPLVAAGVLCAPDRDMFAVYVTLLGQFIEATREGSVVSAARVSQLRGLASSFGLEPSSRSKLHIPDPPKKSEWDDI